MEEVLITPEMKVQLEAELHELQFVRRPDVVSKIEYAKSLGDLSENAEYHSAREEQGRLEERIAKITNILRTSKVSAKTAGGAIAFGSTVVVKKSGGENQTLKIVSAEESDMAQGKISTSSPLGLALIGKQAGDKAMVKSPKGEIKYEIVSVE